MNTKESPSNHELDNEPDEISSPSNPANQSNASERVLQKAGSADNHLDEITLEDEKELAGYNNDLPELLSEEYRIKQDEEEPEARPTGEKPSVRLGLVLTAGAGIMGLAGFIWFGFLAPKEIARQQTPSQTPTSTPSPEADESAELKGKLAFQDQRRQLETKPNIQKQPATPAAPKASLSPVAKSPPPVRRVRQTAVEPPPPQPVRSTQKAYPPVRPAQKAPPPRTIFIRQPSSPPPSPPPPRILQPAQPLQSPPTKAPTSDFDPMERWSQLASLGQTRGLTREEQPNTQQGANSSTTLATLPASPTTLSTQSNTNPDSTKTQQQSTQGRIPTVSIGDTSASDNLTASSATKMTDRDTSANNNFTASSPTKITDGDTSANNNLTTSNPTKMTDSDTSVSDNFTASNPTKITDDDTSISDNLTTSNPSKMTDGVRGILRRTKVNQNSGNGTTSTTKEVAIGTSVNAQVIVPMIWDESGKSPTEARFAVQLTEDMQATDGSSALPTGTILVTQVESVNPASKLVNMSVVALVYPDSLGRIRQEEIPSSNLLIRGENNQPLIAQGLFDNGTEIAKQDFLVGVLNSLGRVGEIINQPRSQSSTSSSSEGFNQTTVTTTSNPNVLAAALEGFFKVTGKRLEQRSDQTVQEMLKRPNVAVVPEGTKVSVFVNSFLRVRR